MAVEETVEKFTHEGTMVIKYVRTVSRLRIQFKLLINCRISSAWHDTH